MKWFLGLTPLLALTIAGCAGQPPGSAPHDMSAADHKKHAAEHEAEAEQHEAAYDPNAEERRGGSSTFQDFQYGQEVYNPTSKHLGHAKEHQETAEAHRKAAEALESFTDGECAKFPPKTRSVCPIMSVVTAAEDVKGGAKLTLKDGVPTDAVLAHMRCHHAFAAQEGHKGMPGCPLYLKNLELNADGKSITITSEDTATEKEIRKRAKAHVHK